MSLFTHGGSHNLHRWCRLCQCSGGTSVGPDHKCLCPRLAMLALMDHKLEGFSSPWKRSRSAGGNSQTYAYSFGLIFYIWDISGWEFPDKSAPRPHFWCEDKGAKVALVGLRLAAKLFAVRRADSCTCNSTQNNIFGRISPTTLARKVRFCLFSNLSLSFCPEMSCRMTEECADKI